MRDTKTETAQTRTASLILLRIYSAVLAIIGLIMLVGGAQLTQLGGSPYYLVAGILIVASAVLLFLRKSGGAWLYAAAWVITLSWSIYEVGFDGWALMPRILAPSVLGIWLLLPWSRRALSGSGTPSNSKRSMAIWLSGATVLAIGIGQLLHMAFISPYLPPDPRFQTGMGSFPAQMSFDRGGLHASDEWPQFGGDLAGSHYSGLSQITPANVSKLKVAWSVDIGSTPGMTSTPIMVDGSLYTCNNNEIYAIDARTGSQRWHYDASKGLDGRCRGVSYFAIPGRREACASRIFAGMNSNRLVALDAATGKPCLDFGREGAVDLRRGMGDVEGKIIPGYYRLTSPPLIVQGKAIVGGYISDNQYWGEPSGVIRAFDAVTGKLVWAWDVGRPDRSEEPPLGENYTHSTPNSWAPMTADERLGLVYVPTGNPAPDLFGGMRRSFDERVGSSVVALDAATGKEVWTFQTKHHDTWDRDVPSQPTLVDLRGIDGHARPALIQATKGGEIFILDRRTGKPIFSVTERSVPLRGAVPEETLSRTQPYSDRLPSFRGRNLREADMWGISPIDQLYCRIRFKQARYDGPDTPLGLTPSIIYPSMFGATNWGGVSVDPVNRVLVVASNRMASYVKLLPRAEADARGYRPEGQSSEKKARFGEPMMRTPYGAERSYWLTALGVPCIAPPYGLLSAIDLNTGKLLWTQRFGTAKGSGPWGMKFPLPLPMGAPNHGGAMVTRSGLLVVGATPDNYLHVFDLRTGKLLWRAELPGGGNSQPITFKVRGKQYIVVSAGGSAAIGARLSKKMVAFVLP